MKENLTFSSAKVSKMDGSPLMERKDNLPSSPKYGYNNDLFKLGTCRDEEGSIVSL